MSAPTFTLFCMGNPLLDIQVTNGEALIEKYKLKENDAILAEEKHAPIYEEIVRDYKVAYVAGGAAQNTARAAAYVLPEGSVVYTGCVGDDDLAEQLRLANAKEGVESAYLVKKGEKTGACAVVLTGHHRSLVTTLRAAEKFDKSHLESPEIARHIDAAKFFYIGGFFLTHGVESALHLARKASDASKVVAINLSAPFIPQFFKVQLEQVFPFCDIIIGNESEAAAWAAAAGIAEEHDHSTIAKALALLPKANVSRPRIVVITRGHLSTILVSSADPEDVQVHAVHKLAASEIVDTNGAGDAFAGGFLGAYILGKDIQTCIEAGHTMGAQCIRQIGPQWTWPKVQVFVE